jgi:hypothetical protein
MPEGDPGETWPPEQLIAATVLEKLRLTKRAAEFMMLLLTERGERCYSAVQPGMPDGVTTPESATNAVISASYVLFCSFTVSLDLAMVISTNRSSHRGSHPLYDRCSLIQAD